MIILVGTNFKDDRLMFYQNLKIQSPRKNLCKSRLKGFAHREWCTTKRFRTLILSSNNPEYLINRKGYVICENDSRHELTLVKVRFEAISEWPEWNFHLRIRSVQTLNKNA